jgi:hypothetical protein
MPQNSVDKSKLGDGDKSTALKRLHNMAVFWNKGGGMS